MRTLRACLLDEPLTRLLAMADLWDAPVEGASVRDVAEALSAYLLQEEVLNAARQALPADAQDALDALIVTRGKMPAGAFERRFGAIRPMGPGKLERERPWLSPINPAETLWYRGFLFRAFDRTSGAPTEVMFVPSDMLAVLSSQFLVLSDESKRADTTPHNAQFEAQNSKLLDDVTTLLCHIQNHEVKLKANGDWDVASRRALQPMMRDGDGVADHHPHGRFAFVAYLIGRLGWTRPVQHRLRLVPQPVAQWLQSSPDAQRATLFDAWLNDPEWNDLAHVEGISLEMTHAWSNDPLRERRMIVNMWNTFRIENAKLKIEKGAAFQFSILNSQFIEHVKVNNPDFARPDGRYDTWHVRDAHTGEFLHGFENWDRVEGALIRYIIEKPLRWLCEEDESDTEPSQSPFQVRGDGQIVIARHLRYERFQLTRIAEWVETRPNAYAYRLSPRSLVRAREQGIRISRVIEFLEASSGKGLPASLQRAITRWGERGAEVRLETMVILRTQDDATMDVLLRAPEIRRLVVDRFAPNCVSIRQRDAEAMRVAIAESGLLVEVM